jgi:hypothetical protein
MLRTHTQQDTNINSKRKCFQTHVMAYCKGAKHVMLCKNKNYDVIFPYLRILLRIIIIIIIIFKLSTSINRLLFSRDVNHCYIGENVTFLRLYNIALVNRVL